MNRRIVELAEYKTVSPKTEDVYDEEFEQTEDKNLEGLSLTPEDQKLKAYLKKRGILTIIELKKGLRITSSSHIGIAQFSEFSVLVLPKILMNTQSLPKLIEYAYDLEDIIIPESEIKFEPTKNLLIEIIISSFAKKCQQILRQGLMKSYVTHEENMPYLRGKLMLQQQFLNVAHKKMQFACEYDELEHDNLENQILRFTLEQCYSLTSNDSLKREIRRLIHQFEGFVEKVPINLEDFERINYTRLNQHYEKIHQLCKLILASIGISDFYKQKISFVNSFFVDMNVIFEAFVAKLFKEFYPLPSEAQKGRKAWTSDLGGSASIRTDILIYDNTGKPKSVVDTKYKKKLKESDRFQIGFYIHEYERREGCAILPKHEESSDHSIISKQQEISIKIKHIDIDETINLLYSTDPQSKDELRSLVESLVPL